MKKSIISLCFAFLSVLHGQAGNEDTINVPAIKSPPLTVIKKLKKTYVDLLLLRDSIDEKNIPFTIKRPVVEKRADTVQVTWRCWTNKISLSSVINYRRNISREEGEEGKFKDLGNNDSNYLYVEHANRIVDIVMFYKLYPDSISNLPDTIRLIIDYLLKNIQAHTYKSSGWYFDSLYVPSALGKAALMFENDLQGDERRQIIKLLNKKNNNYTGQNKIWYEITRLQRGLLQDSTSIISPNDIVTIRTARDSICHELMKKNGADGIQSDWSFHQHKRHIQQFGNYGLEFIKEIAMLSQVFRETSFAFSNENFLAFDSLMREGYRYVLWHSFMDVPSIGRTVSKEWQLWGALYTGQVARRMYHFSDSACRKTGEMILRENFVDPDSIQPFAGHKHFSRSDYTVHRTPKWMTSLRMSSENVAGSEIVNGYNTSGYYQGDGATYTQINGKEFLYIFPLWEWRKIPGITCYDRTGEIKDMRGKIIVNLSNSVGGITVGNGGISAMELIRDTLKAHKTWIFADSCMLCLGYVFASHDSKATSIEQCKRQDDLRHFNGNDWVTITDSAQYTSDKPLYFFHNNIGYVSWNNVTAIEKKRYGCWGSFIPIYTDRDSGNVVSLYISHPANQASTYQYMLLPNIMKEEVRNFDLERIKVLRNDSAMQAVLFDNKLYVAAFRADSIKVDKYRNYTIEEPGIYYYNSYKQAFDTSD